MPMREFKCPSCGNETEKLQNSNDETPQYCEKCKDQMMRVPSVYGFNLTGSGWYKGGNN